MMKGIDADYYGYRDDDDGVLEELERAAEEGSLQQAREGGEGQRAGTFPRTFRDTSELSRHRSFLAGEGGREGRAGGGGGAGRRHLPEPHLQETSRLQDAQAGARLLLSLLTRRVFFLSAGARGLGGAQGGAAGGGRARRAGAEPPATRPPR